MHQRTTNRLGFAELEKIQFSIRFFTSHSVDYPLEFCGCQQKVLGHKRLDESPPLLLAACHDLLNVVRFTIDRRQRPLPDKRLARNRSACRDRVQCGRGKALPNFDQLQIHHCSLQCIEIFDFLGPKYCVISKRNYQQVFRVSSQFGSKIEICNCFRNQSRNSQLITFNLEPTAYYI